MTWYERQCSGGCGRTVAARTNDPSVKVMCTVCWPDDLPLETGQPDNVGTEVHHVFDGDSASGGDAVSS